MALSRRSKRWLILVIIVAVLLGALRLGRNWLASQMLQRLATVAGKGGYVATFDDVEFDLLRGHIRITGVSIAPMDGRAEGDSASTFTVKAGEIDLLGVDTWTLLRQRVLNVGHVELRSPDIEHSFVTRAKKAAAKAKNKEARPQGVLEVIHVDTLLVESATGRSQDRARENPALSVASLDLLITDIGIVVDAQGAPTLELEKVRLDLHGAEAELQPYYTLRIDSLRVQVPENGATVFGFHLTPDVTAQSYHEEVKYQVELYEATVDTIMLSGFDLAAKLEDGALLANRLYIAGATIDIHRDKSIPTVPEPKRKPLLAERIQGWTAPVSLDTIDFQRDRITYHERLKRGEPYGSLTFADAHGRLTGISNMAVDGATAVQLVGEASLWDKARARLELHLTKDDGPTLVDAHVELRDLPATELNRMTDDLVHVNATAGYIHLLEMRLKGDDVRATGTVNEHYEDLHLELSPAIKHASILSFVANTVVRSDNMPGVKGYKAGHFNIRRRQEASVFNYIWLGLREGMMDVMIPPAVLNQLQKQKR